MDLLRTIHRIQRAIGFDTSFKEKSQRNHHVCFMRVVKLSCSRVEVIVNEVQTASESLAQGFFRRCRSQASSTPNNIKQVKDRLAY